MLKVEADFNKEATKVEAQGDAMIIGKELLVVVRSVYDMIKENHGKDVAESMRGSWMNMFAEDDYWQVPALREKGGHTC